MSEMGERQSGSYSLRRAAPKKIDDNFAYFGLKKDEPDSKRAKSSEETHIEILSSPDLKKGRGRPRKSDPSVPEPPRVEKQTPKYIMLESEDLPVEAGSLEDGIEHTEEVVSFESPTEFVLGEDGEAIIQIMDFPIRIETVEGSTELNSETILVENSEEKMECEECHKMLKPSSFRQHLKTHLGSKPHCCEMCPARFTRRGDVERHVRIVHKKDKPFQCHKCTKAFGDKKNLRWHLMNHDKKLFHICETCGFKFGKKDYYDNHVKYIHPIPDHEEEEEVEEDGQKFILPKSEPAEEETDYGFVVRHPVALPRQKQRKSGQTTEIDLSQMQLQSILDQSQGRRIAIVGQDSGIKFLTVTPKHQPKKSTPHVVSMKTLEKMTNLSTQQIARLHAPSEEISNPDKIKAVVIEVADNIENVTEEIIIGQDEEVEEEYESAEDQDNVSLIDALLDAANTSTGNSKAMQFFTIANKESPG